MGPLAKRADSGPVPLQEAEVGGVRVAIFREGTGRRPQESCSCHLVGRLASNGCVFESTAGKGQGPMRMELKKNAIIPGMELALQELSLGSVAEIRIPPELAYGKNGIPRIVPPSSELLFEIQLVQVDDEDCEPSQAEGPRVEKRSDGEICHGWWLARVHLLPPPSYYLNFCKYLAGGRPALLQDAKEVPRKRCEDLENLDVGKGGPFILTGMQEWQGRMDLAWFKEHLGQERQLVKWLGPVFTRQESLWEAPVYETSLAEYVEYIQDLERMDPDCLEENAACCPRLYLNGWPAFCQLPKLRRCVLPEGTTQPADSAGVLEDLNSLLIRESEALRESLLEGLTARGSYQPPDKAEQTEKLEKEDWELTKVFLSPRGAITRLHYDNGGAHAWLSQVEGRKMFVCFAPSDGEHLHPFEGDEGLMNGTWLDPLDPEALQKWPDVRKATPYVAVVEPGETIVAPKGWWHYAVSLDSSVTIMRNFYSTSNQWDLIQRKDGGLAGAIATHVLRKQPKLMNQPDAVINEIAVKTVRKLRETFIENRRTLAEAQDAAPGAGYAK